jgi:hypothetical protein
MAEASKHRAPTAELAHTWRKWNQKPPAVDPAARIDRFCRNERDKSELRIVGQQLTRIPKRHIRTDRPLRINTADSTITVYHRTEDGHTHRVTMVATEALLARALLIGVN